MSDLTRQRHEQRMAERRRGAGDQRPVTQAFGFDIPLIIATPPGARAAKASKAVETVQVVTEPPAAPESVIEEVQRRRSTRLSTGSSVVEDAGSARDATPVTDGSARKRRKVDSSPAEVGSHTKTVPNEKDATRRSLRSSIARSGSTPSRRSVSAAADSAKSDTNVQATPEITVTEVMMERLTVEAVPRTPVTRTTPRVSSRRIAPEASMIMSSPSPLPPRGNNPAITSSVSPEPPQFLPDPIIPEVIEEERSSPQVDPTPEPTPPPRATGLRNNRKKSTKPAVAAVTPVPRGKRRRQPSPDKFLSPEKPDAIETGPEDESILDPQADLSVEQIVREEAAAISSPVRDSMSAEQQITKEATEAVKPPGRRRGRKPKGKKMSVELPVEDLPIVEETPVLSDVEADQSELPDQMEVEETEVNEEPDNEGDFEDEDDEAVEEARPEPAAVQRRKRGPNASQKPRQPGKSKRRNDDGEPKETFDITVHRIPKQGEFNFKFPKQPNNVQIVSEFILGIVDKQLESLSSRKGREQDREEKARLKLRESVVNNFSSALENRLIGMANKADNIKVKSAQFRRLQREKQRLRDELMQIRESREEVARQMDAVRKKHEAASEKASKQQFLNDTLKTLESVVEESRSTVAAVPVDDEEFVDLVGLDALISSVTEDVCGAAGDGKGILGQIREMNRFLEASIASLQR